MNEYKIEIDQLAYFSILECVAFVERISNDASKSLYNEIIESIKSLSHFPNKYPEVEKITILGQNIRKMPIHNGRYLIIFKVNSDTVRILDCLDLRKDFKWNLI